MSYTYPFEKFQELWQSAPLVITDTNGLLNLYRFSPETTTHILNVLNGISNQLWIPAQVLEEYNKNHKDVINREYSKYKEVTRETERIMEIAKNDISRQFARFTKFRFPLVNELEKKISDAIECIRAESLKYKEDIKVEVNKNEKMLKEDKVQLFVEELTQKGNVGLPFNISTLLQILTEGEQRYKYRIPPGYMDAEKDKKDDTKRNKYGDLILWKQVLVQARVCQKPIIFITNDEKEDWWVLDRNNVAERPRDELLIEFREYSQQPLILMNLTNFINHISIINNMVDYTTHLEMNAASICAELVEEADLCELLDDSYQLTSYLIHSGDLQGYLENPLVDVEIEEFYKPELNICSVDIDEYHVIIEGSFVSKLDINVTESYSKDYTEENNTSILISGSISFEFEVDFEKDKDFIKMDTLIITVGGFEVLECDYSDNAIEDGCIICGSPNISYFTQDGDPVCDNCIGHFETCPDCGRLFEAGTLCGAFCSKCDKNH